MLKPTEMRFATDTGPEQHQINKAHEDFYWPPPCTLLHRASIDILSLHGLPKVMIWHPSACKSLAHTHSFAHTALAPPSPRRAAWRIEASVRWKPRRESMPQVPSLGAQWPASSTKQAGSKCTWAHFITRPDRRQSAQNPLSCSLCLCTCGFFASTFPLRQALLCDTPWH